ncbi:hypothetical protein EV356DRAFT_214307 [Viridothelium virens]|uniref:Uncharacterized protein n=1 Tax=Viridothelium virens TaxID=1048519 RepID=A0A6A6H5U2_VIRVR|nr:hypothetical protein EV356DRAFT_214307 [Viridothelium virens]
MSEMEPEFVLLPPERLRLIACGKVGLSGFFVILVRLFFLSSSSASSKVSKHSSSETFNTIFLL